MVRTDGVNPEVIQSVSQSALTIRRKTYPNTIVRSNLGAWRATSSPDYFYMLLCFTVLSIEVSELKIYLYTC